MLDLPIKILEKVFRPVHSERNEQDDGAVDITVQRAVGQRSGRKFNSESVVLIQKVSVSCTPCSNGLKARNLAGAIFRPDFLFVGSESSPSLEQDSRGLRQSSLM